MLRTSYTHGLDEIWHLKDNIQVHCKHIQHLHLHVTCTGQQGTTLKVPPVSASKCDRENPEEWSLTNHHLLGKLCDLGRGAVLNLIEQ